MAHEVCHGLGLIHTFQDEAEIYDSNQKYVYPKYNADPDSPPLHTTDTTDNIMSYNFSKMKSIWKWQWKILKSILGGL
jgi:hypothetical protein